MEPMNLVLAVRPVVENPSLMAIEHNIAGIHPKSAEPKQAASVLQVECQRPSASGSDHNWLQ